MNRLEGGEKPGRLQASEDNAKGDAARCIVVAVNPNLRGQETVDFAFNGLLKEGDRLVVLHVLRSLPPLPPLPEEDKVRAKELQEEWWNLHKRSISDDLSHLLRPHRNECRRLQLDVQIRIVLNERVERALVKEANGLGATRLVLATLGKSSITRKIQGPGRFCVKHCPQGCDVLVVSKGQVVLSSNTGGQMSLVHFTALESQTDATSLGGAQQAQVDAAGNNKGAGAQGHAHYSLEGPPGRTGAVRSSKVPDGNEVRKTSAENHMHIHVGDHAKGATEKGAKAPPSYVALGLHAEAENRKPSSGSESQIQKKRPLSATDLIALAEQKPVRQVMASKVRGAAHQSGYAPAKGTSDSEIREADAASPSGLGAKESKFGKWQARGHVAGKGGAYMLSSDSSTSSSESDPEAEGLRTRQEPNAALVWHEAGVMYGGRKKVESSKLMRQESKDLLDCLDNLDVSGHSSRIALGNLAADDSTVAVVHLAKQNKLLAPLICQGSVLPAGGFVRQPSKAPPAGMTTQGTLLRQVSGSRSLVPSYIPSTPTSIRSIINGAQGHESPAIEPREGPPIELGKLLDELQCGRSWEGPASSDGRDSSSTMSSWGTSPMRSSGSSSSSPTNARFFSYNELALATNGFAKDNMIGKGGYAVVFKGALPGGRRIAVKRLYRKTGGEIEFLTEVGIVSHVQHPHAIRLVGYCIEQEQRLLVYDLLPLGSLERNIHSKARPALAWHSRLRALIGAALGLEYLHNGCPRRIIHRDVKTANILLRGDGEALISDFGLAKWMPETGAASTLGPVEGTFGYMAPEYFMHGQLNEKTDVYSFGIVILEIITGQRPISVRKDEPDRNLVSWALPLLEEGRLAALVDPRLNGQFEVPSLRRMAAAAMACLRFVPSQRPTMAQVAKLLEDDSIHDGQLQQSWSLLVEGTTLHADHNVLTCDLGRKLLSKVYNCDMQRQRALAIGNVSGVVRSN